MTTSQSTRPLTTNSFLVYYSERTGEISAGSTVHINETGAILSSLGMRLTVEEAAELRDLLNRALRDARRAQRAS